MACDYICPGPRVGIGCPWQVAYLTKISNDVEALQAALLKQ